MAGHRRTIALLTLAAFAISLVAHPAIAQPTAAGGGSAASATNGGAASAAGGGAVAAAGGSAAAASGGPASAAAAVAGAAAAAGGAPPTVPSGTPALDVVQPVLVPVTPAAYASVIVQQVTQFSDQYCTPAAYTAPVVKPANYTGPGMSITFNTGVCTINSPSSGTSGSGSGGSAAAATGGDNASLAAGSRRLFAASTSGGSNGTSSSTGGSGGSSAGGNGVSAGNGSKKNSTSAPTAAPTSAPAGDISCTEPSITVTKTPAIYTSKYTSAEKFVGKECKVAATVGTPTAEILYIFDDQHPVDPLALSSLIQSKLASILTEGYQDLVKQIATSITFGPATADSSAANLAGSAAAASVAGMGR